MSDKVKPWHQRKPKHQGGNFKNQRPKNKGRKHDSCQADDSGEDIDEGGSMFGGEWIDDPKWKT